MKPITEINTPEFEEEVLHSPHPVLVGFLRGWARCCRRIEPVLEKVAGACIGKVKVLKVNVDKNPGLAVWYGIQTVPTLIYFTDGNTAAKFQHIVRVEAILAKLNSLTQGNTPTKDSGRPQ